MKLTELKELIKEVLLEAVPFDKATDIEYGLKAKYDELGDYTFGVEFEFEPVVEQQDLSTDQIIEKLSELMGSSYSYDNGYEYGTLQYNGDFVVPDKLKHTPSNLLLNNSNVTKLPDNLTIGHYDILSVVGCYKLHQLPKGLKVKIVEAASSGVRVSVVDTTAASAVVFASWRLVNV